MVRRFLIKLLVFSFFLLFVLEMTVRIFAPQQLIRLDNLYIADNGLGRIPASNLDLMINTGERDVLYKTDGQGHRIGTVDRGTPDVRILALGDSFTVAMQVEYEQTTTALLENQLSEALGENVQVLNSGSANFDVNGYRIAAERELSQYSADLVVVFIYTGNDITSRTINAYQPQATEQQTYLRLPTSLNRKEIENALIYPINNLLESSSHLFVLFKDRASIFLARLGLTKTYFPDELLRENADDSRWSVTAQILSALQDEATQHDVRVIFVLLPSVYQVDSSYVDWAKQAFDISQDEIDLDQPQRLLEAQAAQYDLDIVDVLPPLREAFAGGLNLYGQVDTHLSPEGHQVVANYLEPHILEVLRSATTDAP